MYRNCHRCQAELVPHDDGALIFCTQCGAAQVQLSEELREQSEANLLVADGATGADAHGREVRSVVWQTALRCVGAAGVVTALLALGSTALPALILLAWLWAVVSPVVVIGVFQVRSPETPMTAGLGARIGLLTGLMVALVLSVVNAVTLAAMRHAHAMGEFDAKMAGMIERMRVQVVAQPGAPALPLVQAMTAPEFHAGMLLGGLALGVGFLLVITTVGGAFAGFVRSRGRA